MASHSKPKHSRKIHLIIPIFRVKMLAMLAMKLWTRHHQDCAGKQHLSTMWVAILVGPPYKKTPSNLRTCNLKETDLLPSLSFATVDVFSKKKTGKTYGESVTEVRLWQTCRTKTQNSRIFRLIHGHEIQFYARKR